MMCPHVAFAKGIAWLLPLITLSKIKSLEISSSVSPNQRKFIHLMCCALHFLCEI